MTGEQPLLRYVVLRHTGYGEPHFDLMFETSPGSALATWRSGDWPVLPASVMIPLHDHRRHYLQHEGPLSGDRGEVRRVAAGAHRVVEDTAEALVVKLESGAILRLPRVQS